MKLDDPKWPSLLGGHGVPYDPRPAFAVIEAGGDAAPAWQELWENLHHQG